MSTRTARTTSRPALSRSRVIDAALDRIDANGLDALSMHKLGAELGVKAMSLYNHVANKSDVLDGVVAALWNEVEMEAPAGPDWRAGLESFAHAMRAMVRRHPNAAPLVFTQRVMPESALRVVQIHVGTLVAAGFEEAHAYDLARTVTSYVLGSAFAEVTWDLDQTACAPEVSDLLRPDTPEDLAAVAQIFCGQSDFDAQFELGLALMLDGIGGPSGP